MNTPQVADKLRELLSKGQFEEAQRTLFHENVISVEPEGVNIPVINGLENVIRKGEGFRNSVAAWHGIEVSAPIVAKGYFAISLRVSLTYKGQESASSLDEIIVYQVKEGKVTHEEFFYLT